MNEQTNKLVESTLNYRDSIIQHPLYSTLKSPQDIRIFMKYHVFAVWDFMSLLKTLQNNLTCTSVPWIPVGNPETRYLINEIVTGEESDVDLSGNRISHFELYLKAMEECAADKKPILSFIENLSGLDEIQKQIENSNLPKEIQNFLSFTFSIIQSGKPYLQAAVFTFGREDLIPGMFISLLKEMKNNYPDQLDTFYYYMERHIEIDGEHHSKLAFQMTEYLCGEDAEKWEEAKEVVQKALEVRKGLWDGVFHEIINSKN